jgi:penicillin-binding protein 1B
MDLGLRDLHAVLGRLGVHTEVPSFPSAFLGTLELSPLEVTQMYQVIASGGFMGRLRALREVTTGEGRPLHRYGIAMSAVTPPPATFLLKFLLTEVVRFGTASTLAATFPDAMPLAGKTGTTSGLRDSWYVGFGDDLLATIWIGRDDNRPTGLTGASGAMRVWSALMREHPPKPVDLTAPRGVEWHWVEPTTRARTDPDCPGAHRFPFIKTHLPGSYLPCRSVSDHGQTGATVTVGP